MSRRTLDNIRGATQFILMKRFKDINFNEAFKCLTDQEVEIIKSRYGLECDQQSLEVIGTRLNLTRERIRQIQGKALRKLRRPYQIRILLKLEDKDIE